MIVIQLFIPLIAFGIIIYISHYLIPGEDHSQTNSFFGLKSNEICSQNSSQIFPREIPSCWNISLKFYKNVSSDIHLIIKYSNENQQRNLFEEFVNKFNEFLLIHHCQNVKLIQWNSISKDLSEILFKDSNSFRVIIDLKEMTEKNFHYDLIVPQSRNDEFNDLLKEKIDLTFLQLHQHPSEQIVRLVHLIFH